MISVVTTSVVPKKKFPTTAQDGVLRHNHTTLHISHAAIVQGAVEVRAGSHYEEWPAFPACL